MLDNQVKHVARWLCKHCAVLNAVFQVAISQAQALSCDPDSLLGLQLGYWKTSELQFVGYFPVTLKLECVEGAAVRNQAKACTHLCVSRH